MYTHDDIIQGSLSLFTKKKITERYFNAIVLMIGKSISYLREGIGSDLGKSWLLEDTVSGICLEESSSS